MAALGGLLNYLQSVSEGKAFKWLELILQVAISAFCGLIVMSLLTYHSVPPTYCGGICGLAGWMGTRLLKLFEIRATREIKGTSAKHSKKVKSEE